MISNKTNTVSPLSAFASISFWGLLLLILIVFLIRVIIAYFIAKRGNMIVSAKGYVAPKLNMFSLALFMTIFFGIIPGYIFVFWYACAFPTVDPTTSVNPYTDDYEDPDEE